MHNGFKVLNPHKSFAIDVWNMIGGLNYPALPLAVEYYGISDVEMLLAELMAIRDHVDRVNNG